MSLMDDKIASTLQHLNELKRAKGKTVQFEKTITLDEDIRRQIIIGGMLADVLPQVLKLTPKPTEAENEIEFASLDHFLHLLLDDKEHTKQLVKRANAIVCEMMV